MNDNQEKKTKNKKKIIIGVLVYLFIQLPIVFLNRTGFYIGDYLSPSPEPIIKYYKISEGAHLLYGDLEGECVGEIKVKYLNDTILLNINALPYSGVLVPTSISFDFEEIKGDFIFNKVISDQEEFWVSDLVDEKFVLITIQDSYKRYVPENIFSKEDVFYFLCKITNEKYNYLKTSDSTFTFGERLIIRHMESLYSAFIKERLEDT